jgi:hypothetical protein
MRKFIFLLVVGCLYGQDNPVVTRERVRAAMQKLQWFNKTPNELLYTRKQEKRELAADGTVRSTTTLVTRRDPWDERMVTRVIEKDGKPLPADEVTKQEIKLRKQVEEARKKPPKLMNEEETWMDELPDALEFSKVGTEQVQGRETTLYEFHPRPGYKAKQSRARAFEKVQGKVWVDLLDTEVVKLDVLVIDTISMGFGVLGRVEKGTHFEMERKKWDIGAWFETWQRVRFDLRLLMVKSLRQEIEVRWSNLSFRPPAKMIRSGS